MNLSQNVLEINIVRMFEFTNSRITHYYLIGRVTQILLRKYKMFYQLHVAANPNIFFLLTILYFIAQKINGFINKQFRILKKRPMC